MHVDTLILGAGAAGLFCAAQCGGHTLVIDHAKKPAEKIRISGGGRCNFTNMGTDPSCFLGENPHFPKSALSRYTQWDFIDLVDRHAIPWHEKTLGQLFCDRSATDIIDMLLSEMRGAGAELWLQTSVVGVSHDGGAFQVALLRDGAQVSVRAKALVLATGGKSIPKMGATGLAYDLAAQFGHRVTETRPALVPFTFPDGRFKPLAGVAAPARIACKATSFDEALLFTHRGLSGPAVLQISSYWREGDEITVTLAPETDLNAHLRAARQIGGRRQIGTALAEVLPARLVQDIATETTTPLANASDATLASVASALQDWSIRPQGTEGYRTAEVTLGGVATDRVSSKTMESRERPGLYIIGEALDVTGWLGGYNFQWAWASGFAAGRAIAERLGQT